MTSQKLPMYKEPVKQMPGASLASETAASHPVKAFQNTRKEREFRAKLESTARLYGIAAAMRMKAERDVLIQIRRPPGLPSSMVGLETVLGTDETIDFEDFLSNPYDRPDVPEKAIHERCEAALGL